MIAVSIAIFLVSGAVIGLELVLVRALSIGHWHHFSFLVISTALLGFGGGGVVVTIFSNWLVARRQRMLWLFALLTAWATPLVFLLSSKVPLDELQIIWHWRQSVYLLEYYLLFAVPFFFAGSFVALAFTSFAEKSHRLYFFNMTGSGFGAAAIVGLMYGHSPEQLLLGISVTVFVAAGVLGFGVSRRCGGVTLICAAVGLLVFAGDGGLDLRIRLSQHKSLVWYSRLPDSETLSVRHSPLGRLDCVAAPGIHILPGGLSIGYQGRLAEQSLIISDGDAVSVVNKFERLSELEFFRQTTSALPHLLVEDPDICILGVGGGSDIAQALLLGAGKVTAVEMNPQVTELIYEQFGDVASRLFERDDVELVFGGERSFLQRTEVPFDVISISLPDSVAASAAGLYALNESRLYTVEAVGLMLRRLRGDGLLGFTLPLKVPARHSLKILATIVEALSECDIVNPGRHIMMIRRLHTTATIVVSPAPFSRSQIDKARRFAREHSFDLVHVPGIRDDEVNRYHVLEEAIYYEGARRVLSSEREGFYRDYVYNIRPAMDDRPYFFDFFKVKSLPHLARSVRGRWLPLAEWGYLVLMVTALQAVCAGALFILLPLWFAKPVRRIKSRKFAVVVYFGLVGLGYMFLEMGFIQKATLLTGHPVFGVAVTLVGFLVFSGCGSLVAGRVGRRFGGCLVWASVTAIIIVGGVEIVLINLLFERLVGFSQPVRFVFALIITGPLAFFMGMPFPTALRRLNKLSSPLVPWAWAVNGFASVAGAVVGTVLAVSFGFTAVLVTALVCYLLATAASKRVCG